MGWTGYGGVKKRVGDLGFRGNIGLGNFQNMQPMLACRASVVARLHVHREGPPVQERRKKEDNHLQIGHYHTRLKLENVIGNNGSPAYPPWMHLFLCHDHSLQPP